jgi:hypothetical protein
MRKKVFRFASLLLFGLIVNCCGVEQASDRGAQVPTVLYPVKKAGKWGYIDNTGKLVIMPQFFEASDFHMPEGVAPVRIGPNFMVDETRYIDTSGKYVTPAYAWTCGFSEGLAPVRITMDGKEGYIDNTGKTVIQPQFERASEFSEGLAAVRMGGKWGFIDKTGRIVIDANYAEEPGQFSEGLATVRISGKTAYIDKSGKIVISPRFDSSRGFSEGLAATHLREGQEPGKWGFIDKAGNVVVKPQFDNAWGFAEGLAAVQVNNKWGYVDRTGRFQIPPQFDDASHFSEGLAAVRIRNPGAPLWTEEWGYIDKTGQYVIKPQFRGVSRFKSGLAGVMLGEKEGYIDRTGRYIWQPTE